MPDIWSKRRICRRVQNTEMNPQNADKVLDFLVILDILVYMGTILIRNVPNDLRKEFKLLCIQKNTNMTEELIRFIREEVEKAEKGKLQ